MASHKLPAFLTNTKLDPSFKEDVLDTHLMYDYDAQAEDGTPEKWRYEAWFVSENRIVYAIHGGPMAGRVNYQTCTYQCVRPHEIWQISWLEETGTVCSAVWDIQNKTMTTLLSFSEGHWTKPKEAHGDKRNPKDFARWKELAKIGKQTDRFMLSEQGHIVESFKGKGDLEPIDLNAETL